MTGIWRSIVLGAILVAAWGAAYALRPTPVIDARDVDLERQIPDSFGQWRHVRTNLLQVDLAPRGENGQAEASILWPYDQTLSRAYQRADGQTIMLALAWGSKQRQEIKVHRPELCYSAQGLQVVEQRISPVNLSEGKAVSATRLLTKNPSRIEPVTYWVRIGESVVVVASQTRLEILREGLHGRIPDGILVRVSQALSPSASADSSYEVQDDFIRALFLALDAKGRRLLVGGAPS